MATLRGEITISAAPAPCATSFGPRRQTCAQQTSRSAKGVPLRSPCSRQSLCSRSRLQVLNLLRSKRKFRAELRSYLASLPRREPKREEHAREPDGRRGPTILRLTWSYEGTKKNGGKAQEESPKATLPNTRSDLSAQHSAATYSRSNPQRRMPGYEGHQKRKLPGKAERLRKIAQPVRRETAFGPLRKSPEMTRGPVPQ